MRRLKIFLKSNNMNNDTAVLLIAFGRVELARRTFDAIKAAKPSKFYFYTNAGRPEFPDECKRNEIVRSMAKEVDWPCEFKTWFRERPVGVLDSIRLAINWVFENEEKAIIMEEDCVGSPAWFTFANEMLDKFRDDKRIWMIGGSNYANGYNPYNYSYNFSRFFFIYGWASWRDRWEKIDWNNLHPESLNQYGVVDSYYPNHQQRKFFKNRIRQYGSMNSKLKTWDYAFWNAAIENNAYCVIPPFHLVQNIGVEGVHAGPLGKLRGKRLKAPYNPIEYFKESLDFSNPPIFLSPINSLDHKIFNSWYAKSRVWYIQFLRKVYHIFKK